MSSKYILALDLGISSCGWTVVKYDEENGKSEVDDFGVRLFEVPEKPKKKTSLALIRRMARSSRRLKRRRKARLKELKTLFEKIDLVTVNDIKNFYNPQISKRFSTNKLNEDSSKFFNPYEYRVRGLDSQLLPIELAVAILHITMHRGYENLFNTEKGGDDSKVKSEELDLEDPKAAYKNSIIFGRDLIGYDAKAKTILKTIAQVAVSPEFAETKMPGNDNIVNIRNHNKKGATTDGYKFLFPREAMRIEMRMLLEEQFKYYNQLTTDVINQIIDIAFRQRDFEDGFGPGVGMDYHKRRQVLMNQIEKLRENRENTGQLKMAIKQLQAYKQFKPFTELVGKCTLYPSENRFIKSSLVFSVYQLAIEISKFSGLIIDKDKRIAFHNEVLTKALGDEAFLDQTKEKIKKIVNKTYKVDLEAVKGAKAFENLKDKLLEFVFIVKKLVPSFFKETKFNDAIAVLKFLKEDNLFDNLGRILNENITPRRRVNEISVWAEKNSITLENEGLDYASTIPKKITTTCRLSKKAMIEVLEHFEKGEIAGSFQEVLKQKAYDHIFEQMKETAFLGPINDPDVIRNPVVFRALNQTRKVLKALFAKYGKFNRINIETTKELGRSGDERNKLTSEMRNNEQENLKMEQELKNIGIRINATNRLKIRLWKSQKKKCVYSLRDIPIEKLESDDLEIDHIIPYSIYPNDSINNKVLVYKAENREKSNQEALKYIKIKSDAEIKAYLKNLEIIKATISDEKYNLLQIINFSEENSNEFISRNLVDTSYITRYIRNWLLKNIQIKFGDNSGITIQAIKGRVTSRFRRKWLSNSGWGLDKKVREITPWHHAVDAMILAQFKNEGSIAFAEDAILICNVLNQKNKLSDKQIQERLNEIMSKWNKDSNYIWKHHVPNAKERLQDIINNPYRLKIYPLVSDLEKVIAERIPIKLSILNVEKEREISEKVGKDVNKSMIKFNENIPKFERVIFPEEYMELLKNVQGDFVRHYPCISYMENNKIAGDIRSSENVIKKSKAFVNGALNDKYMIDKNGNIWETCVYYGVKLKIGENKFEPEWIKLADLFKNKNLLNCDDNEIILKKNSIVSYVDKISGIREYKWFNGKNGSTICANLIGTTKISSLEANKEIFAKQNSYDSISNWKNQFKIHAINVLGYLRF